MTKKKDGRSSAAAKKAWATRRAKASGLDLSPVTEKQVGGTHYNSHKIQPWDIIDEYALNYYAGNAIKYILRYPKKNGVEDIDKAIHYLEKLKTII